MWTFLLVSFSIQTKEELSYTVLYYKAIIFKLCLCIIFDLHFSGGVIVIVWAVNSSSKYLVSVSDVTWGLKGGTSWKGPRNKTQLLYLKPTKLLPRKELKFWFKVVVFFLYTLGQTRSCKRVQQETDGSLTPSKRYMSLESIPKILVQNLANSKIRLNSKYHFHITCGLIELHNYLETLWAVSITYIAVRQRHLQVLARPAWHEQLRQKGQHRGYSKHTAFHFSAVRLRTYL